MSEDEGCVGGGTAVCGVVELRGGVDGSAVSSVAQLMRERFMDAARAVAGDVCVSLACQTTLLW